MEAFMAIRLDPEQSVFTGIGQVHPYLKGKLTSRKYGQQTNVYIT
jgi:hypothetical protein